MKANFIFEALFLVLFNQNLLRYAGARCEPWWAGVTIGWRWGVIGKWNGEQFGLFVEFPFIDSLLKFLVCQARCDTSDYIIRGVGGGNVEGCCWCGGWFDLDRLELSWDEVDFEFEVFDDESLLMGDFGELIEETLERSFKKRRWLVTGRQR